MSGRTRRRARRPGAPAAAVRAIARCASIALSALLVPGAVAEAAVNGGVAVAFRPR